MSRRLWLASLNAHKAEELGRMLVGHNVEVLSLASRPELGEPPETGATFEENALQKARFVFEATGEPALADDSGLEVDALGGAPGVHSKRFTPEATAASNNRALLAALQGVNHRRARFVCALALVSKLGEEVVRGTVEGEIGHAPRGEGGFGYDPLFLPVDAPGRTMAELSPQEKDHISHRGRAVAHLPNLLADLL